MSLMTDCGSEVGRMYSRKDKSLRLLCCNFLDLYNRDDVHSIGLDEAAKNLGVERRRIYDIVNVLESVGMLARKAKNQYWWKGFGGIPKALEDLRNAGYHHTPSDSQGSSQVKASDDEDEVYCNSTNGSQPEKGIPSSSKSADNRREKSLALLTQNFVKLFVCSNVELISLDDAAKVLIGDGYNSAVMRSKVRRLYDIANVLSSVNLIEKHKESKKPAYRWLGIGGIRENESANVCELTVPKKRSFGTEITNIDFKRPKLDDAQFVIKDVKAQAALPEQLKTESLEYDSVISLGHDAKQSTNHYRFGPFAPARTPKPARGTQVQQIFNFESLAATFRPQYQNQAVKELYGHYLEAWNSWYTEVVGTPLK